jgi:hypothetical protein
MRTRVSYTCEKCGYNTDKKSNYDNHQKRKTPCVSVQPITTQLLNVSANVSNVSNVSKQVSIEADSLTCQFCRKSFKHRSSKSRHVRFCTSRHNHDIEQGETDIEVLKKEILNLKMELQTKTNITHTTVNQINNGVINNNNITINAFGQEDVSYISGHPNFQRFMVKCIKQSTQGVCEYMLKKHFHPNHPENHNIRKLNRKDNFIEYFDGRNWTVNVCDEMFHDIFRSIEADFQDFMKSASPILSKDGPGCMKKHWIDNFMEKVGVPLEWDLDCSIYEFENTGTMDEQKKMELKTKIYKLACEYIYRHSKTITNLT